MIGILYFQLGYFIFAGLPSMRLFIILKEKYN